MSADQEVLNLDHKETSSLLSVQNQISGAWGWQGECFAWETHCCHHPLSPLQEHFHSRSGSPPQELCQPPAFTCSIAAFGSRPHPDQLHPWKPKSKCSIHWPQPFLLLDHLLWLYLFLTSLKRPLLWLPFLPHLLTFGAYTRQREREREMFLYHIYFIYIPYICFCISYIHVFAYHMFLHIKYMICKICMHTYIYVYTHTIKFFFLEKAIQFKGLYSFLNIVYPFLFFFTF